MNIENYIEVTKVPNFLSLTFHGWGSTGRAGERGSEVELGAGTVDTTGLIRRASLDVGTSYTDRQIVFGIPP